MTDLRAKNRKIMAVTLGVVFGMIALAYASVPLYRLTCQVMGWGGTTQTVAQNNSQIVDRDIKILFNANTSRDLPWHFAPEAREITVKVGQDGLISFLAENAADQAVTGTAVYNVTPLTAGKYFYKTQCFCFEEQVLNPRQKVHMPVVFFVDPSIMDDPDMKDLKTITLSYTFFRKGTPELEKAKEKFYSETGDSKT